MGSRLRRVTALVVVSAWLVVGACVTTSPSDSGASGASGATGGNGGGAPVALCVPGRQIACQCVAGTVGAQICKSDGSGYLSCTCAAGGGMTGAGGTGDAGASGTGASGNAGAQNDNCAPLSCVTDLGNLRCGTLTDGCGKHLDCGTECNGVGVCGTNADPHLCTAGCGADYVAGKNGSCCVATTCDANPLNGAAAHCGDVPDECRPGATVHCPTTCPAGACGTPVSHQCSCYLDDSVSAYACAPGSHNYHCLDTADVTKPTVGGCTQNPKDASGYGWCCSGQDQGGGGSGGLSGSGGSAGVGAGGNGNDPSCPASNPGGSPCTGPTPNGCFYSGTGCWCSADGGAGGAGGASFAGHWRCLNGQGQCPATQPPPNPPRPTGGERCFYPSNMFCYAFAIAPVWSCVSGITNCSGTPPAGSGSPSQEQTALCIWPSGQCYETVLSNSWFCDY